MRHEPIDEAHLVEPLCREAEAERHLHRDGVGHIGKMAVIVAAQEPAFCLRNLEQGLGHRDAQIGALNQHEASAHGKAIHGSDDWLLQRAVHERIGHRRALATGRAGRERFFHVLARAEAASGAGEDRDLQFLAASKLGPSFSKRGTHLAIERIEPLRAVHAYDQDLSVTLGFDD